MLNPQYQVLAVVALVSVFACEEAQAGSEQTLIFGHLFKTMCP